LKPLLAVPKAVVYESNFAKSSQLKKTEWQPRQGTRWAVEEGVLRGRPSSAEYQASKTDHKGLEPRVAVPITPSEFVLQASVRFKDGQETAIVPFIEFTHHKVRVQFTKSAVIVLADHESVKLADTKELKYEPGKWYSFLAELKGEEFVIQFADGPRLFATHKCFTEKATAGAEGFGVAGPRGGIVELDRVKIWDIGPAKQPAWEKERMLFPEFKPVVVKNKKGG
jgi:hypothetical protein